MYKIWIKSGLSMQDFYFRAVFYDEPDGTEPAKEFLDSLDAKMFAKMIRAIEIVKSVGTAVREPYSKHLEDGIFEIRAQVGSDISRVLFFFFTGRRFVLTHGFVKKTKKTPPSEIERAKIHRAKYLSREENKK
jgi:phage-related protein